MGSMSDAPTWAPRPTIDDSVFKMFSMEGKTVIISGGSSGIGYEVARGLAEAGANIALWYNTSQTAHNLAEILEQDFKGIRARAYKVRVENYAEVEKAVEQAVTDFGKLDVMIANASIPSRTGSLNGSLDDWNKVRAIDFDGAYHCARAAGMIFKEQGFGNCIFTGSMSGHIVNQPQDQACYNACKAGVIHLMKSLAVEWAKWGGRVNSVSPGYVDTPLTAGIKTKLKNIWFGMVPLGRDADPREMKAAFLYLASDASSYATGTDIVIDGGYSCR